MSMKGRMFAAVLALLLPLVSSAQFRDGAGYDDLYDGETVTALKSHVRELSAALDSLKAYGTMMNGPAVLGGLTGEPLSRRYHVIIGAFKARENAEKLASKAVAEGYDVQLIEFRRGMVAVGTCPSDKIAETVAEFGRLRNEKFCPGEAWILVNE